MPGCKVGDKVIFINPAFPQNACLLGVIGTITKEDGPSIHTPSILTGPFFRVESPILPQINWRFRKGSVSHVPDSALQPIRPPAQDSETTVSKELPQQLTSKV